MEAIFSFLFSPHPRTLLFSLSHEPLPFIRFAFISATSPPFRPLPSGNEPSPVLCSHLRTLLGHEHLPSIRFAFHLTQALLLDYFLPATNPPQYSTLIHELFFSAMSLSLPSISLSSRPQALFRLLSFSNKPSQVLYSHASSLPHNTTDGQRYCQPPSTTGSGSPSTAETTIPSMQRTEAGNKPRQPPFATPPLAISVGVDPTASPLAGQALIANALGQRPAPAPEAVSQAEPSFS